MRASKIPLNITVKECIILTVKSMPGLANKRQQKQQQQQRHKPAEKAHITNTHSTHMPNANDVEQNWPRR